MLNYRVEERAQAWVIRFDGDLSGQDDRELRKLFVSLVDDEKVNVVADMQRVTFLDSTVLGTLVWGMKNLRETGGDLRMFGIHDFVKRLFNITQLDRAFQVFETEDDAVGSFA